MRNSASGTKDEKLKSAYQDAKKARKKAKASYKAKLKELKAKLKPVKQALKEAEKAEKQARAALKAQEATASAPAAPMAAAEPTSPKKRGRQPGYSPKAAKAAAAAVDAPVKEKGKPGRKPAEKPATTSTGADDLTLVKGVGENIAVMLRANGISSYADMAATSFDRYKELLKANGMSKFRDPSEWAARAATLANLPAPPPVVKAEPAPKVKGKPGRKPGFSPKAAKAVVNHEEGAKATASSGADDLTLVKGVGENIAVMLRANGISSYADMAATSFDRYKELLKANGMSKFRDPSEWAARAAALANLAAPAKAVPAAAAAPVEKKKRGRQPGYSPKAAKAGAAEMPVAAEPVEKKKRGRQPGYSPKAAKAAAESVETPVKVKGKPGRKAAEKPVAAAPVEKKKRGRQPGYSPKAAKAAAEGVEAPVKVKGKPGRKAADKPVAAEPVEKKKRGRQPGYSPKAAKAAAAPAPAAPVKEVAPKAPAKPKGPPAKPDDLTQVKGVGGRVAEALNKEGIYTYKDMATVSLDRYKEILKENNMSKFRDPSDWAKIASELAAKK